MPTKRRYATKRTEGNAVLRIEAAYALERLTDKFETLKLRDLSLDNLVELTQGYRAVQQCLEEPIQSALAVTAHLSSIGRTQSPTTLLRRKNLT
jgi:hypothetical protein